jgi:hypothetical protein
VLVCVGISLPITRERGGKVLGLFFGSCMNSVFQKHRKHAIQLLILSKRGRVDVNVVGLHML